MSKTLDWSKIAQVNFDDKRRQATGMMTGKELFQKSYEALRKAQEIQQRRKDVEPLLKALLIEHMTFRKPIQVLMPIQNPTEALNGIKKGMSDEEDDNFYNSSPSQSQESVLNARFEETMEVIPSGTTLTYKGWDKQLGQWLFKGSNGQEYAIYDKSAIMYRGSVIENPGLFGLLFSTNLVNELGED